MEKKPIQLFDSDSKEEVSEGFQEKTEVVSEEAKGNIDYLEQLIRENRKIEAIKEYRDKTGVSLKESKEYIEVLEEQIYEKQTNKNDISDGDIDSQLRAMLVKNQLVLAIKYYRDRTGTSLKEAKAYVDRIAGQMQGEGGSYISSDSSTRAQANLEAPNKSKKVWVVIGIILIAAYLIYKFM
jgi:ribosomal protein L7/L12